MRSALLASEHATPLAPANEFPSSWDDGASFCWSKPTKRTDPSKPPFKQTEIPPNSERAQVERRLCAAIEAVDVAEAREETRTHCPAAYRAVRVRWLKALLKDLETKFGHTASSMTTADVAARLVQPATAGTRGRYVDVLEASDAGLVNVFVCHPWAMVFAELVSCILSVVHEDTYVWLDIFAVRQWPGNTVDRDVSKVISAASSLLLCSPHNESVVRMSMSDAIAKKAPRSANFNCAFFRLWCVHELTTALKQAKPVVILVGEASMNASGAIRFDPSVTMMHKVYACIDAASANTSVPTDTAKLIDHISTSVGVSTADEMLRSVIATAGPCMGEREVLSYIIGHTAPLDKMRKGEALGRALRAAAASGLMGPLTSLLSRDDPAELDVNSADEVGYTALMAAALGGHAAAVDALLTRHASVVAGDHVRRSPLMFAAKGGHVDVAAALIAKRASLNLSDRSGRTPLMAAAAGGHTMVVRMLESKGARVDDKDAEGCSKASPRPLPLLHCALMCIHCPLSTLPPALSLSCTVPSRALIALSNALARLVLSVSPVRVCSRAHVGSKRRRVAHERSRRRDVPPTTIHRRPRTDCHSSHWPRRKHRRYQQGRSVLSEPGSCERACGGDGHGLAPCARILEALRSSRASVRAEAELLVALSVRHACVLQVMEVLVKEGAETNVSNEEGRTPLMDFVAAGHVRDPRLPLLLPLLLQQWHFRRCTSLSAAPHPLLHLTLYCTSLFTALGQIPLCHLQLRRRVRVLLRQVSAVASLVDHGRASVDTADHDGRTAIMHAATHGVSDGVEALIARGALVDTVNNSGTSALMMAASGAHLDTMKILIDHGAGVDVQDHEGLTPMMYAAEGGQVREHAVLSNSMAFDGIPVSHIWQPSALTVLLSNFMATLCPDGLAIANHA